MMRRSSLRSSLSRIVDGKRHRPRLALRQVQRIEAGEVAEALGGILVVGDAREMQQVVRCEVVADR
jgi:hypothetical protein